MKVRASVKKICRNCKIIKRKGTVRVICVESHVTSSVKANCDSEVCESRKVSQDLNPIQPFMVTFVFC